MFTFQSREEIYRKQINTNIYSSHIFCNYLISAAPETKLCVTALTKQEINTYIFHAGKENEMEVGAKKHPQVLRKRSAGVNSGFLLSDFKENRLHASVVLRKA